MSGSSGQNRVLDHDEIFGEIVSELNESDDKGKPSPSEVAVALPPDPAPIATPPPVPAVEDAPAAAAPESDGGSSSAEHPEITEEATPVSAAQPSPAPVRDREVACWVDATLSLVTRSATRAANESSAPTRPAGQLEEPLVALFEDSPGEEARPRPTGSQAEIEDSLEVPAAEQPAEPRESLPRETQGADQEAQSLEDLRPAGFTRWQILFVAILIGLLAGVLAAFLTTRLLYGSWLPRPPAAIVSQTTAAHRAVLDTTAVGPPALTAADSDVPQQRRIFSTSASGKAPVVSPGAL